MIMRVKCKLYDLRKWEQPEDKGKKSGVDTITDKVKEKVTGAGRSVKEGFSDTIEKDDDVSGTESDLDSAQTRQRSIGEADSNRRTTVQQRIYVKKLQQQQTKSKTQKNQLS